ncbi:MAG: pyridoxal-phosphate dependent enzyme, partial [Anaerolineae bacterium]
MHQPYQITDLGSRKLVEWPERRSASNDSDHVAARPPSATHRTPAVVSLIGHTALVPLTRIADGFSDHVRLAVKLEGLNPGGSVKDRAALFIVREALRNGSLGPGRTLVDATSGNTGIAYAMLGAALGFRVHLALPADVSPERIQIL